MTDKELRTLDEMLTNLEVWSTWNKTFANEMMGICSKMRNLLADRKTENSSEKPNNSTISKMEQVDWKDQMWTEAIVTEPTCDTCRHKGAEGCEQPCLGCGCCGLYEVMTGNDKLKEKVVEFIKTCARCKHRPIGAMMCEESCHYEPKPTTQTETQNSNLTFEKRTMRDCYNCKRYETEGECIECHYEPRKLTAVEDEPQTSCKTCRYGEVDEGYVRCAYYSKSTEQDEPQTDCYVSDLCKHYGDKQICGRCRNRNLFAEAEPQPRCPKCGKRGYIRSLESMGVKLKAFDEYKWKCTNCNKYFKEEPKDEPQTCEECEHWNDTEDGCADRHGCKDEPQTTSTPYMVDTSSICKIEPQTDCQWK